jgi:serine/threonine protein kinase
MGQVYLAKDNNLGTRQVAVKTVRQDLLNSEDLVEGEAIVRFEREAQAAASIRHPHVVDVTDFGKTTDGVFYLVMEYVEGETLHRLLRREGTLDIKRAVNLLKQIAEGVDAAHDAGILHRDLKPANIFIMNKKAGNSTDGFIKVGDFGLAKIVNQTVTDISSSETPSSRGIIGTPEYMSPEQMQPELGVDVRADVYALGTIAYLMLGGRTPFIGDMMQLIMQKVMQSPPPLSTIRTDIPQDVDKAIMHALEREADKRPASIDAWINELDEAVGSISQVERKGNTRLVILAPIGAEVYVDDERKGSVGSSGRVILTSIPFGQHILRISKAGEKDDERVIEVREGAGEQVIQAQLKPLQGSQPSPSQQSQSGAAPSSILPAIVACTRCNARFAAGVRFCGKCGNSQFAMVSMPSNQKTFPCPRCSSPLPTLAKFCGKCGLNLVQNTQQIHISQSPIHQTQPPSFPPSIPKPVERICRNCGKASQANSMFCGGCGNRL